jgi:hypothetical protein
VNRFTRQTLPTVKRKYFLWISFALSPFAHKTHKRTLVFGSIFLKHCRHFASWNQPLNMCMLVCYLDCHESGLCCYLVIHVEHLLLSLQLFHFRLWPIYWLSLVPALIQRPGKGILYFMAIITALSLCMSSLRIASAQGRQAKSSIAGWLVNCQGQSLSYFSTDSLPPITNLGVKSLEYHDYSFFFWQLNTCCHCPYVTSSLTRGWVSLLWIGFDLSSLRIAHIACYWKFILVHHIEVLIQYRFCKADHVYLTYLMPLSHLNGRKRDHRQV